MLTESDASRVYLACGATDMRKSIDGLAAIVSHAFELDPLDTSLFVFCNKGRDKLKILRWENNGFWLYYRRLERGRFRWPQSPSGEAMTISRRQLAWLLDGLPIEQRQAHKPLFARVSA
jgi:transposase